MIISRNDSASSENEVQVFNSEIVAGVQSCASLNW